MKRLILSIIVTFIFHLASGQKWVEMMKASILGTYEQFNVKRMLEEYYDKMYRID